MNHPNTELVSAVTSMAERAGIDTTTPAVSSDSALWKALSEAGFTAIGIPESRGGSGGTTADALSVVHAAAAHGALTMTIEHTVLASPLLAQCAGAPESAAVTVAIADHRCTASDTGDGLVLDGTVTDVVHGSDADLLVVVLAPTSESGQPSIAVVEPTAPGVTMSPGWDLSGSALDDYRFEATPVAFHTQSPVSTTALETRGAMAYSVALAAAAGAVRDRTLRYARERNQFGHPLTKFQAIQQRLAGLAALTALMETAASAAVDSENADPDARRIAVAAAKVVTSASAREVAAAGHQIHGAIGFTAEHSLGRFTTALWSRRHRFGSENYWSEVLAEQMLDAGTDVWDIVTGTADVDSTAPEGNSQ